MLKMVTFSISFNLVSFLSGARFSFTTVTTKADIFLSTTLISDPHIQAPQQTLDTDTTRILMLQMRKPNSQPLSALVKVTQLVRGKAKSQKQLCDRPACVLSDLKK